MRIFLKITWYLGILLFLLGYILSCFTAVISPESFSPIAILGMMFPYLFLGMTVIVLIEFIKSKKLGFLFLIFWIMGLYNASHIFAIHPHKWAMQKDSTTLRILTWNVSGFNNSQLGGHPHGKEMLDVIKEYNPDVLCLQEYSNDVIYPDGKLYTKKALDSLGYPNSNIFWYETGDSANKIRLGSGVAIFTKKHILLKDGTAVKDLNGKTEGAVNMDFVWDKKGLRIVTGRLSSFYMYTDTTHANKSTFQITMDRKDMAQRQIRMTEQVHQRQVSKIRESINNSPVPAIYCGDMNSVAASYNYYLMKGNLQDAFLEGGFGIGASFYNIVPTLRIDVCFVDKSMQVLQSKVIKKKASDHYPVVTDMKWRN